ncbi:unnamed protein product [Prorocentrum cordatum]|uniref:Uncharacterized protein n=1 Tax=Prorocentrum cordatum TaxID=2364126 RepID=A0ABN9Y321_9DINO|nr:unnamed protein product [Polarella glacialis]
MVSEEGEALAATADKLVDAEAPPSLAGTCAGTLEGSSSADASSDAAGDCAAGGADGPGGSAREAAGACGAAAAPRASRGQEELPEEPPLCHLAPLRYPAPTTAQRRYGARPRRPACRASWATEGPSCRGSSRATAGPC